MNLYLMNISIACFSEIATSDLEMVPHPQSELLTQSDAPIFSPHFVATVRP